MEATLRKTGVAVRFDRVPEGRHGSNFQFPTGDPQCRWTWQSSTLVRHAHAAGTLTTAMPSRRRICPRLHTTRPKLKQRSPDAD